MVLSQRERYIAIGLGALVVLVVVWLYGLAPLLDWSDKIKQDEQAQIGQKAKDETLFLENRKLQKVWAEMQKGGLMDNPSDAQTQLHQAVTDWAIQSGVQVSNQTNESAAPVDAKAAPGFVQAGIKVSCFGTTSGIAKLLYQIEVAKIPARVHQITISSKKEGMDDLQLDMTLTTLCVVPVPKAAPNPVQATPTALNNN